MEEDFRFLLGLADRSRDGMSLSGVFVLGFLPVLISFYGVDFVSMGGKAVPPSAKPRENNKRLRIIVNKSGHGGSCMRMFEKGV